MELESHSSSPTDRMLRVIREKKAKYCLLSQEIRPSLAKTTSELLGPTKKKGGRKKTVVTAGVATIALPVPSVTDRWIML